MKSCNTRCNETGIKTRNGWQNTKWVVLVSAFLGTSLTGIAQAERSDTVRFADELDSCVTAVTEHLDLTDANRVRHTIVEKQHSGLGYALSIETSVFADGIERRYSAYCVANGAGTPLKFRIDDSVS